MTRVLVTGFGPFLDVRDNPSGRVARALDRRVCGRVTFTGMELPVTYADGPAHTIAAAEALDATLIVGLGVDRRTATIDVETRAYNLAHGADTAGCCPAVLDPAGPPLVYANVDATRLAASLGARVDDDAGRYVCNAWLYLVARALQPRRGVVFIHVPGSGLDPDRLLAAIGALFDA